MSQDARAYVSTLLVLWVVLAGIGYGYSQQQNIPTGIALWLLAAFLVEAAFYLAAGFAWTRSLVESIEPPAVRAFILTLSALVPYVIYAAGTGTFHWRSFLLLAAIATVISAWFVVADRGRPIWDLLFVALLVTIILSKVFDSIYIQLAPKAAAPYLGFLMLVHTGAFSVLSVRKMSGVGFSFAPRKRDWAIGLACFAGVMLAILLANSYLNAVHPRMAPGPWWRVAALAAGTFLAFLWVTALAEEFVFRGILQQALSKWTGAIGGLLLTSTLFGLAHLPFRHFPNWPWVVFATILGLFCGIAAMRSGSIRAATVTHALVVATWRAFFN